MQRRLVQIDESIARYLSQLDSADRQGEAVPEAKITRLNEKIAALRQEIKRLNGLNTQMMQTEDKQISLTDPDARSMATSGRGSGMVGYNVQSAVDTKYHLIVTHEVTNVGSDRSQLSRMSEQARAAIGSETIEAVADRGYYSGEEIVTCEQAGITVYLPKPMTSGLLAKGRFGKQDFVYVAADDVYLCPAGEQLTYHYTNEEEGKTLRRYWTTACQVCALKSKCTTGKERRISRWEQEAVLEAVQARLDRNPAKMRERRQTVEHPFGTIKSWMGATHFQMKTLKNVGTEMALHVLAYNMKRVISILGVGGLMEAIRA
jgi:Transposase DDE domain